MNIIGIVWQMCVENMTTMKLLKVSLPSLRHPLFSKLANRAQYP